MITSDKKTFVRLTFDIMTLIDDIFRYDIMTYVKTRSVKTTSIDQYASE